MMHSVFVINSVELEEKEVLDNWQHIGDSSKRGAEGRRWQQLRVWPPPGPPAER